MKNLIAAVSVFAFAAPACSHRVTFNTDPAGAKLYIDGKMIGVSPATYVEKSGMARNHQIKIEKEGYQAIATAEQQGFNLKVWARMIFCPVGVLWAFTLEDSYTYNLERETE